MPALCLDSNQDIDVHRDNDSEIKNAYSSVDDVKDDVKDDAEDDHDNHKNKSENQQKHGTRKHTIIDTLQDIDNFRIEKVAKDRKASKISREKQVQLDLSQLLIKKNKKDEPRITLILNKVNNEIDKNNNINNDNNENKIANNIDVSNKEDIHMSLKNKNMTQFEIDMASEATLLYMICTTVCCLRPRNAIFFNKLQFNKCIIFVFGTIYLLLILSFETMTFIKFFQPINGQVFLIKELYYLFCWIMLFLNLNYNLIYFKKTSLQLIWNLWNMIGLHAIWMFLNWHLKKTYYYDDTGMYDVSLYQNIIIDAGRIIVIILSTYVIALHQGLSNLDQKWKILIIVTYIGYLLRYLIPTYLDDKFDYTLQLFDNKNIYASLRSILISKLFDTIVWFTYILYQVIRKPLVMRLDSKIKIEWVED